MIRVRAVQDCFTDNVYRPAGTVFMADEATPGVCETVDETVTSPVPMTPQVKKIGRRPKPVPMDGSGRRSSLEE